MGKGSSKGRETSGPQQAGDVSTDAASAEQPSSPAVDAAADGGVTAASPSTGDTADVGASDEAEKNFAELFAAATTAGLTFPDKPVDPEGPQMRPCEICGSSFNDELGCANAECELNLERMAKAATLAERAALIALEVPKARECKLCNGTRPCSPEHYMAAGYEVTDEKFVELFGEPLRLSAASKRSGRIRCKVLERVAVGATMHLPGDVAVFDAGDVDSAPHCFEELG